jgi:hypothetical protein
MRKMKSAGKMMSMRVVENGFGMMKADDCVIGSDDELSGWDCWCSCVV